MEGKIEWNTAQIKRRNFQPKRNLTPDRRCGIDRRKSNSPEYFRNGGIERRSWRERRNLWYMTM